MKKNYFPFIGLGLGLILLFAVFKGSQQNAQGDTMLPLLTLLLMSEFAFFVTAIGAYLGFRKIRTDGFDLRYLITTVLCVLLSVRFIFYGFALWPL
ncbi:MAG: hypothetical protein AAF404_12135 [Pseudomonadota bacterium]